MTDSDSDIQQQTYKVRLEASTKSETEILEKKLRQEEIGTFA